MLSITERKLKTILEDINELYIAEVLKMSMNIHEFSARIISSMLEKLAKTKFPLHKQIMVNCLLMGQVTDFQEVIDLSQEVKNAIRTAVEQHTSNQSEYYIALDQLLHVTHIEREMTANEWLAETGINEWLAKTGISGLARFGIHWEFLDKNNQPLVFFDSSGEELNLDQYVHSKGGILTIGQGVDANLVLIDLMLFVQARLLETIAQQGKTGTEYVSKQREGTGCGFDVEQAYLKGLLEKLNELENARNIAKVQLGFFIHQCVENAQVLLEMKEISNDCKLDFDIRRTETGEIDVETTVKDVFSAHTKTKIVDFSKDTGLVSAFKQEHKEEIAETKQIEQSNRDAAIVKQRKGIKQIASIAILNPQYELTDQNVMLAAQTEEVEEGPK